MLEYCLDVSPKSYQRYYTNDFSICSQFPFCLTEHGYFEAGLSYYTHRNQKAALLYLYTISGEGFLSWNGGTANLKLGSAVLIDCMQEHEYKTVSNESWSFFWMHFTGDGLKGIAPMLLDSLHLFNIQNPIFVSDVFKKMDAIHDRSDRFALANRSFLIDSLLHMLLLALEKNELGSQMGSSEIVQAIEYIHLHLAEPISVDTLATCCNLSKYHFIRLFDRKTGFTPYHYIQIMRIDKAKKYLVSTDKNISEIAFSVGFGSEANFGKVFRSMTGSTPSAYRKEQFNWSSPQNMGKNENA